LGASKRFHRRFLGFIFAVDVTFPDEAVELGLFVFVDESPTFDPSPPALSSSSSLSSYTIMQIEKFISIPISMLYPKSNKFLAGLIEYVQSLWECLLHTIEHLSKVESESLA
jgi:hypothetical protein